MSVVSTRSSVRETHRGILIYGHAQCARSGGQSQKVMFARREAEGGARVDVECQAAWRLSHVLEELIISDHLSDPTKFLGFMYNV